ncbi:hypothetical protein K493DRAFT_367702 [Basidiobolus meristosporus CBS 931.73]|uniref:G-protein coupled receptors family 1 profile domain-containing protein n=1 Tax=Basidiobolus meristosporus CBS 931.73 TaxID=1314790 RepID=A0A1Y1VVP5_9FUNG|nr:hypothetical protein K493DRAFT_367702 [Basidiobolus meristosporus CBS 931.73]|eukprot:ORX65273.1 hypothetical protein K493DRAFT_367702 [Basidiobolus meristosporus CBS 931.73]
MQVWWFACLLVFLAFFTLSLSVAGPPDTTSVIAHAPTKTEGARSTPVASGHNNTKAKQDVATGHGGKKGKDGGSTSKHGSKGQEEEGNHHFSDFAPHRSIFFYLFTTITATLNICCSAAVIYTSYTDYQEIKYQNAHLCKKPHLSSSIRFPFYITMLDLFLGFVTLFMVSDTMYFDKLPSSKVCAVIGGIIWR